MFKKILVPLDNTQLARRVLDVALSVADRFDAEVTLLRIHAAPAALDDPDEAEADLTTIEAETQGLLDAALSRLPHGHTISAQQVDAVVRSGPLVTTIADAAEELMADLVVMGTHGRQGFSEMFTGSTTEQIVARTPPSVLVVKPDGFPFLRDQESL